MTARFRILTAAAATALIGGLANAAPAHASPTWKGPVHVFRWELVTSPAPTLPYWPG